MEKKRNRIDTGIKSRFKDSRPLKDKDFQEKCAKSLIKNLIISNYNHPISLSQCLSGDLIIFRDVMEFLLKQLDPSLAFTSEKDIQNILKSLDYPFPLHSQYFSGAINYWPHLLSAMSWLADAINVYSSKSNDVFTEYFLEAYNLFLHDLPYTECTQKFTLELVHYNSDIEIEFEKTKNAIKDLRSLKKDLKIDRLNETDEKVKIVEAELREGISLMASEEENFNIFEANLNNLRGEVRKSFKNGIPTGEELKELIACSLQAELELESTQNELIETQQHLAKIKEFEENPENIEVCGREMIELQEEIDSCRRECSFLMEEIEIFEESHSEQLEKYQKTLENYKSAESSMQQLLQNEFSLIIQHSTLIKSLI